MTPATRRTLLSLCALLAVTAAVVFVAIAIDGDIYAPGAGRGHVHAGLGIFEKLPPRVQHDLSIKHVVRKIYSVVAFGIVGFLAAPFVPKEQRVAGCTVLLAVYSLVIEILQKFVVHSPEGILSNLFDIGCGALGGWLGALAFNGLAARLSRP